jgi:hypothetical protein
MPDPMTWQKAYKAGVKLLKREDYNQALKWFDEVSRSPSARTPSARRAAELISVVQYLTGVQARSSWRESAAYSDGRVEECVGA